jgi:hypothetical protein
MKLIAIRLFLCAVCTLSCALNGATNISINSSTFSFETQPRLIDVLAPVALQEDWYWPASSLHKLGKNTFSEKRNEVISKLEKMRVNGSTKEQEPSAITTLIKQIKLWQLAERIPLVIDYDFARTKASLNPLFDKGDYLLTLLKRPRNVYAFGALVGESLLAHKDAADVSDYLAQLSLTAQADNDYVYIIQADGKILRAPYAYWNKGHQEIMPGSQLFIPFKKQLFSSDYEELNQQIVYLAANRILP